MISNLEKQQKLFSEWKSSCPNERIIADGIVSESSYNTAKYKILFLLKEVNGWGSEATLCDFLAGGGMGQTWNNVVRWTKGILSLDADMRKDTPWKEIADITNQDRKDQLQKICVINIKKTPGGPSAIAEELTSYVDNNKERLHKQLDICNPDIIICCGTASHYKRLMGTDIRWDMTSRGIPYVKEPQRLVVDYYHPQARMSSALLYYALIDAIREIIKTGL